MGQTSVRPLYCGPLNQIFGAAMAHPTAQLVGNGKVQISASWLFLDLSNVVFSTAEDRSTSRYPPPVVG